MPKAILVMDMPDRCFDCEMLYYEDGCTPTCRCYGRVIYDPVREVRADWCPLRELPEKIDEILRFEG